jgi:hypothetical protein
MPRHSPYRIELSGEERCELESLARSYTLPYWQVARAQMVLLAAQGLRNDQIGARLNCRREVVSQWRKALLRVASGWPRRPAAAGSPADLFPLTSALR